jgi:hypothetical protein
MSLNLGNWADQLRCDLCSDDDVPPGSAPPDPGLPDDFWDEPPEPPEDGLDFQLPDYYPTIEFPEGGVTFGVGGKF